MFTLDFVFPHYLLNDSGLAGDIPEVIDTDVQSDSVSFLFEKCYCFIALKVLVFVHQPIVLKLLVLIFTLKDLYFFLGIQMIIKKF